MPTLDNLARLVEAAVQTLRVDAPPATVLPADPGLYTLGAASPDIVRMLPLPEFEPHDPLGHRVLYLGKAEDSLVGRLKGTHFMTGESGRSTVRRTFGALLGFKPIPRPSRIMNPDRRQLMTMTANYAFTDEDDSKLTEWMVSHLAIRVFASSHASLGLLERAVGARLRPPLDQEQRPFWEPNPWRIPVAAARKRVRDQLRAQLA